MCSQEQFSAAMAARRLWLRGCGMVVVVWRMWLSGCGLVAIARRMWPGGCDLAAMAQLLRHSHRATAAKPWLPSPCCIHISARICAHHQQQGHQCPCMHVLASMHACACTHACMCMHARMCKHACTNSADADFLLSNEDIHTHIQYCTLWYNAM